MAEVRILSPDGAIAPTGTWSLGTRAGDFVFVAGMRGIDPKSNTLVDGEEARIRQAFTNMKKIADSRRSVFHKLGLDAVEIETGGSFVRPLRDLFARRAKRIRR